MLVLAGDASLLEAALSVLTAKETQVQILWDLSRLLEQNLIPQQQWLCFESPLAEELEGKSSVPNVSGSSPKGVGNFPGQWEGTDIAALRNRSDSSCLDRHRKCQRGASRGAECPTGTWWKTWPEGPCVREVL